MGKIINVSVDSDIYEKFTMALTLNKEDEAHAVEHCLKWYIAKSFEKASQEYNPHSKKKTIEEIVASFHGKANKRIPVWALRPEQYNHKIIKAYFKAHDQIKEVTVTDIQALCSNEHMPDLYVPTFKNNYNQMKIDAVKSHGKVFEEDDNGVVTIWDEVKDTLMKYKEFFIEE